MIRLKSTLLALSLLTASPVFAQTNITGDWDVTVTSPQGTNTTPVTFKQEGAKVSGMFKAPQGTLPFENGSVTGDDLKFTFTINAQGMELPITLTGKITGDTIAGKADFGGFAEGDWTAKRASATADAAPATTTTAPATTTTAPAAASSTGGAGGKWDVLLVTPGGEFPATASLTDTAGKITGTFASQMGEVAVTGTVEGKALKMTMVAQTPQGEMTVVLTGDVDGDTIVNGQADVPGVGAMPWSAKRVKQ